MRGRDCGAHLDRGDLRYQRKQARIVRRAGLAVVPAVAPGVHVCVLLRLAALVQALVGVPAGIAVQVPPVVLPVGAVLGVVFGTVGVREQCHQHSVNTATALEATFQVKMSVSPNDPE